MSCCNCSRPAHGRGIRVGVFAQPQYCSRRSQRSKRPYLCKAGSDPGYKKANVLIDSGNSARLADFGLTTIIDDSTVGSTTGGRGLQGTARWMAPELLQPERFGFPDRKRLPSKGTDVYALGMTILEVRTSTEPLFKR